MKPIRKIHVYKAAAVGAVVVASILSSAAFAQSKVLTDAKGMTVYTFDKDAGGKSTRYGSAQPRGLR